jgi:3alpha(or 20beta)-hydroxysteroid dehydrogenase
MGAGGQGRLAGKVALISGGARGLGAAIGRLYVREGAAVMLADIRDAEGEAIAEQISREEGGSCVFQHLDVRSADEWEAAVSRAERELGPVDILVTNAFKWVMGNVADVDPEAWQETIDIILNGAFNGIRAALPGMRERRQGSIIAISSSVGGEMAAPDFAPYQAAKSGLTALIKHTGGTFAAEGVRANAIHPGPIRTPALEENGFTAGAEAAAAGFPISRVSEPDEIAWAAVYLGSDESTYMTASKMVIDGGSSSFLGAVDQSGSR